MAIAGAVCLAIGSVACAADGNGSSKKQATTKSTSSGKSIPEAVSPTKDDVVIWVKVTGSLIPQRYVVRNGQILSTANNTSILLTGNGTTASYSDVANLIVTNIPDATVRRR